MGCSLLLLGVKPKHLIRECGIERSIERAFDAVNASDQIPERRRIGFIREVALDVSLILGTRERRIGNVTPCAFVAFVGW